MQSVLVVPKCTDGDENHCISKTKEEMYILWQREKSHASKNFVTELKKNRLVMFINDTVNDDFK